VTVVGVLALQGAFAEHERMLAELGQDCVELRDADDLARPFDRLVLPGGESTVQGKLLRELGMLAPLRERIAAGMPTLGTCAGLILLARDVDGGQPCLATMPVRVVRNAYGRQLGSFHARATLSGVGEVPMSFIRAPYVSQVYPGAQVLARVGERVVAVRAGSQLGLAFHPELDGDTRIHELFLSL
jgi:5'-phosphate synthase pdxT subunit